MLLLAFSLLLGLTSSSDPLHEGGRTHNKEHIHDHLKELSDADPSQMSAEELQFHYFKLHDYDKNGMLDGIELTAALTHFDAHIDDDGKDESQGDVRSEVPDVSEEDISNMVDQVLEQEDLDGDGYVSYSEFRRAQNLDQ